MALRQLTVHQEGAPDGANETLLQTLIHSGQTEAAVEFNLVLYSTNGQSLAEACHRTAV